MCERVHEYEQYRICQCFRVPELSKENRLYFLLVSVGQKNKKFTPPENNPLITLVATKKDTEVSSMVDMVPLMHFVSNTCSYGLVR
jgi:hypothetical protein